MDGIDFPTFFGECLKRRRKALDLTQEELSTRAGCSVFALRLARDIHSTPLILESLTGLASLEMRLDPERVTGWLMLIRDHPAARQDVKDRACQLTREAEALLSADQMQRIREEGTRQSLETIAAELVRS